MIPAAKQNFLLRPMLDVLGADSPSALELIELHRGEVLTSPDAAQRHAYFPISALISIEWESSPHCRAQIDLIGAAEVTGLINLDDDDPRRQLVVAVPGHAVRVPLCAWPTLVEVYPAARVWLEQERRAYARSASITAACAANHSVIQRLAGWLLYATSLAKRTALPVGQLELARFLAVRRESVGSALTRFGRRGLITLSRRQISVERPEVLAREACRCNGT